MEESTYLEGGGSGTVDAESRDGFPSNLGLPEKVELNWTTLGRRCKPNSCGARVGVIIARRIRLDKPNPTSSRTSNGISSRAAPERL